MAAQTIVPGGLVVKDPNARRVYQYDWTDYLEDLGTSETIASSTFIITGSDALLTFDSDSIITGALKTQVRLLAGTAGVRYTVTNRIVTNGSPANTDDRSFVVLVQDR